MRPLLAALVAALLACAGASPAPATAGGDRGAGGGEAERLYRSKCSGCHRAYEPSSRTQAQWRNVLSRMIPKAHLTPPEEERLRVLLMAGASDAAAPGR
jgi:hypothetical protein